MLRVLQNCGRSFCCRVEGRQMQEDPDPIEATGNLAVHNSRFLRSTTDLHLAAARVTGPPGVPPRTEMEERAPGRGASRKRRPVRAGHTDLPRAKPHSLLSIFRSLGDTPKNTMYDCEIHVTSMPVSLTPNAASCVLCESPVPAPRPSRGWQRARWSRADLCAVWAFPGNVADPRFRGW